jgi:hypothetical protein
LNTSDFIHTVYACELWWSSEEEQGDGEAAAWRGWILAIDDREIGRLLALLL